MEHDMTLLDRRMLFQHMLDSRSAGFPNMPKMRSRSIARRGRLSNFSLKPLHQSSLFVREPKGTPDDVHTHSAPFFEASMELGPLIQAENQGKGWKKGRS